MMEPTWTENYITGSYTATATCDCGRETRATVSGPELFRYRQGAFVQDAFPHLTSAQREALFISGICGVCWDSLFGDDE